MRHVWVTVACAWVLWSHETRFLPAAPAEHAYHALETFATHAPCEAARRHQQDLWHEPRRVEGAVIVHRFLCLPQGVHPADPTT
jgi:hypothetical protein